MPDIRERFRSLDRLPAPDLWAEVADRAQAPQRTSWPFALGAVAAVVLVAVVIGLQLRPGDLVGGPVATETASASASGEPSASAEPSPSVQPSADASAAVEPAFSCDFPLELPPSGTVFPPLVLQDVRLGTHEGYDRIVFEYDGGTPEVEIDIAQPPYMANPSGMELSVSGSPVYRITLHGASKWDAEYAPGPYTGPTNFEPVYRQIVQFRESGDFEATHSWYLGVSDDPCLRVFRLDDPARVVIDIQH